MEAPAAGGRVLLERNFPAWNPPGGFHSEHRAHFPGQMYKAMGEL